MPYKRSRSHALPPSRRIPVLVNPVSLTGAGEDDPILEYMTPAAGIIHGMILSVASLDGQSVELVFVIDSVEAERSTQSIWTQVGLLKSDIELDVSPGDVFSLQKGEVKKREGQSGELGRVRVAFLYGIRARGALNA